MAVASQQITSNPQWTRLLVWSTIGSTIGAAVPNGYSVGVINSPAVHMRAWCKATLLQNYGLQLTSTALDTLWAMVVSLYLIGGIVSATCAGWIANRYGRRACFLVGGLLLLLAAIGFLCCRWLHSVELLLLGRFVAGFGSGVISTCLPLYHSELAALSQRGTLGVSSSVGSSIGMVIGQLFSLQSLLGSEAHWHLALSFYVVFMLICFLPYSWYAESPKWLYIVKQQREEALIMLKRLRGNNVNLQHEILAMELESASKYNTRSLIDILRDSRTLLPVVLICSYQGGKQLVGCSSIFYYSVSIFSSSGVSTGTAEWLNLCAGTVNLVTSLFSPWLMAKFNRRTLMLISTFFCALLMFLFGCLVEYSTLIHWLSYGTMATIFLYIFFFQLGLGCIPSFIGAELFEVQARSVALSLGNQMSWIFSFLMAFLFPIMHSQLGSWIFVLFGISSVLLYMLTKRYLPETRNREVSVVTELVSHGFRSKVL